MAARSYAFLHIIPIYCDRADMESSKRVCQTKRRDILVSNECARVCVCETSKALNCLLYLKIFWKGFCSFTRYEDVHRHTKESFAAVGRKQWSNACRQVDSVVQKAMKNDHFLEVSMDKLIINRADDCDSNEFSASDSDSDWFLVTCWCFKYCSAMVILY